MSFYNMINGVNTEIVVMFLPMLNKGYDDFPRIRDVFLHPHEWTIHETGMPIMTPVDVDETTERLIYVLTRVGGGNRDDYATEIAELRAMPEYVEDYDDKFDSTYATFVFRVGDQWKHEFDSILAGDGCSDEYKEHIKKTLPNIADKLNI